MAEAEAEKGSKRAAPYVGYPSYKNMVGGFHETITPNRIDRSVLGRFSGVVGSQLLQALRFFQQIDAEGHPTDRLHDLVASYGTDNWASALSGELRRAFGPVFELDLRTASPAQFTERFRSAFPGEGETLRKGITFFLSAARDAQVPINDYITKNKKPRTASNGTRKTRPAKARPADPPPKEADTTAASKLGEEAARSATAFRSDLLNKFPAFDPTWPDDIKAKWFAGFEQFMAMAKE